MDAQEIDFDASSEFSDPDLMAYDDSRGLIFDDKAFNEEASEETHYKIRDNKAADNDEEDEYSDSEEDESEEIVEHLKSSTKQIPASKLSQKLSQSKVIIPKSMKSSQTKIDLKTQRMFESGRRHYSTDTSFLASSTSRRGIKK